MLTPYQFASNTPIQAIDLDGLEYYYSAQGMYLGQGDDPDNNSVFLATPILDPKTRKPVAIYPSNLEGEFTDSFVEIYSNHDDFQFMAGVLYAEADGTTTNGIDEAAAIYSVLENRAEYENTTVKEQMTIGKGVFGAAKSEREKINQAGKVGMTTKKEAVYGGLIKGIISETDFSKGAYFWDGKDFNENATPNGGYKERYVPGFVFSDKSHDLFGQGNNEVDGETTFKIGKKTYTYNFSYKYESTAAIGKTTFSKLTDAWRNAQYFEGKAKKVGKGKEDE